MKTNSAAVDTRKTLQEIINVLNSFNCSIQRINPDPFGMDQADIEVVMIGMANALDTFKNVGAGKSKWGVQVYVYDMGKYRHCELVALGESGWTSGAGRSMTDIAINGLDYVNMRHSKTYREKIIRKLDPIDTAAEKRKADSNKSRLYSALNNLPEMSDEDLFKRLCGAMAPVTEHFLVNHPDYSEAPVLAAECAGMYHLSGNQSKADEIIRTMKVSEGDNNLDIINASSAELLQAAEDDALSGNERSALYVLAFYAGMYKNQGNKSLYFANGLLDKVLRLENTGVSIEEDLKVWPLLAEFIEFDNWHEMKYGEYGTSGRMDASDPALKSRTAMSESPETVQTASKLHTADAASEEISQSGIGTVTVSKRTLIIAAAVIAAVVMALLLISLLKKPDYNTDTPAEVTEEYNAEDDSDDSNSSTDSNSSDVAYGTPLYAEASSQHADMGEVSYPAENVTDGDLTTAWVEGAKGEGRGEWILVSFETDGTMSGIIIRNGYQKSDEAYTTNNRVKEAIIEFEDGSAERFTLEDLNNSEQAVMFSEEKHGNKIKLIIQSAYKSEDGLDTCITEIGLVKGDDPDVPIVYAERVE